MRETTFKLIKWLLSMGCLILGIHLAQTASATREPVAVGGMIVCFSIVFWCSKVTYEAPKKILWSTFILLILSGAVARNLVLPFYTGPFLEWGFYKTWCVTLFAVGIPVMAYLFPKAK